MIFLHKLDQKLVKYVQIISKKIKIYILANYHIFFVKINLKIMRFQRFCKGFSCFSANVVPSFIRLKCETGTLYLTTFVSTHYLLFSLEMSMDT
ncbi:uncharacterized protein T551_03692 [Pneumocystis jirovecii RU7]|uniref:Uncharacterized protein n=1 Tax=Pneumocystis jirovecii (strain RU7) TaxID=1408657 RepID=A0A0W4ZAY5_PNEJ7|nr:uncharacterized protein T551_03692 [Pneumocystis jirovecii RU7]KTW25545.1 hypothetical protein T551_03692 [Pneumocystis jirovecii RU7]